MVTLLAIAALKAQGDVSGKVTLPNGKPAYQAIVIFQGEEKSRPLAKASVDQRDRTFIPHVSVVTVGTKVEFPNNDVVFHNVFTEFHSTKFDLGIYPKGTSKSQVFLRTGLAVIMCSIHPEMSAYVMVVDTPYYAVTDRSGKYSIHGMAAGHYKLEVWHESGAKASLSVDASTRQSVDIPLQR